MINYNKCYINNEIVKYWGYYDIVKFQKILKDGKIHMNTYFVNTDARVYIRLYSSLN